MRWKFILVSVAIMASFSVSVRSQSNNTNEAEALELLQRFNQEAQVEYYEATEAWWAFYTNITDYNQRKGKYAQDG
ncbi:hypothetical protein HOLleu_22818 [Holothuria leucospilota]|uniref:Uncharacterized protein n=1 Tax=Holothuria leucospilota TaxID=206669 RepID=A0A9Q1BU18_HOLLE|nr:hypothetical protein HOLleu_22818 [Holothuria leucospilota]